MHVPKSAFLLPVGCCPFPRRSRLRRAAAHRRGQHGRVPYPAVHPQHEPGERLDAGPDRDLHERSQEGRSPYDEAEQALVAALQKESFDLIIGAARDPQFNPNDLARKGSLPPASRSALAAGLTSEAFAAAAKRAQDRAAGPVGNETMLDFYLRTGGEGLEKLADYAVESPEKWGEARLALAGELRAAFEQTQGDSITDRVRKNSDFRSAWRTRLMQARQLPGPGRNDAATWLSLEAGLTADILLGGIVPNQIYYDVLGPDQADTILASIRQRLGVPAESLGQ